MLDTGTPAPLARQRTSRQKESQSVSTRRMTDLSLEILAA